MGEEKRVKGDSSFQHFFAIQDNLLLHARELRWAAEDTEGLWEICRKFLDFWDEKGILHFRTQQEILFPFCERCEGWKKTPSIFLLMKQRDEISKMVERLRHTPPRHATLLSLVRHLSDSLARYVRHEKHVLLEEIQSHLSPRELAALKLQLEKGM